MSNPTTPFSWQMPTSTDLVTDLPADFEVFGQAVATSMADLLGGTTGQVLSKASNTDMDFSWVAQDDSNAIQNAIVDAKGDLIAATAADTPARLAVGTNGQILTADSTAATGLKWATSSPSALTLITTNTFSSVSSVSLPTSTFTSTYTNYKVIFIISTSSASPAITGRYRASGTDNTASTYYNAVNVNRVDGSSATQNNVNAGTAYNLGYVSTNTVGLYGITLDFLSPQAAAKKQITGGGFGWNATVSDAFASYQIGGFFNNTTQFDSFSFIASTGTITGSYYVYGYANS
jgi:predicted secreted protein